MEDNKSRNIIPYLCILRDSAKKRLLPLLLLFLAAVVIRIAVVGIPRLSLTIDIDREELSYVAFAHLSPFTGDYLQVPYAANREELDPLLDAISGRYTYVRTVNAKYGGNPAHILLILGDAENNPSESFLFSYHYLEEWLCVGGGDGRVHCYIRDDGGTSFITPLVDYLRENGSPVVMPWP